MTKQEQQEFDELTDLMAHHMTDPYIASMGQAFHKRIAGKYGKDYALEMTDRMMSAVCDMRMWMIACPFVHPTTGEVLE